MGTRVSTKHKLISQLESADSILKDILNAVVKRQSPLNLEPLVELLLEKDQQLKATLAEVETQNELQKKIDALRADCAKSDKQITACQFQLKKAEILLSTALYYSRQKLDTMATAVKNPIEVEELVRFAHRISATHGVSAPDNWVQGDPRRPYPNREEIRRGYLGHLDDNGQFRSSLWDALAETAADAASSSHTTLANTSASGMSTTSTPGVNPGSNPTHHPNPPTSTGAHHGSDSLALSGSPNMILPGVNMVSSPLAVPQANPSTWTGTNAGPASGTPSSAELSSPQTSSNRPSTTSLAAMLSGSTMPEPHHRVGQGLTLPPPPLRTIASQPVIGSNAGSRPTQPMTKLPGVSHRANFSLSPGTSSLTQQLHAASQPQLYSEAHVASSVSPKAFTAQRKHGKYKSHHPEDVGMISSDTSSDSSSGDD